MSLSLNNLKFERFLDNALENVHYDSSENNPGIELPAHEESHGNRYATAAETLAQALARNFTFKVVGKTLYWYDEDACCYQPIVEPVKFLYQALDNKQCRRFLTRDLEEVSKRLLFSKHLSATEDDFNAAPYQVNLNNGIWDAHSHSVQPHSQNQLFTYNIHASYVPARVRTTLDRSSFDEFCRTSLDDDPKKKTLLLEIIGILLSDCPAKAAFFLVGESNTGKSVLLNFISRLIGEELISSVALHKLGDRFNIAELWGKKLNLVGEIKGKTLPDITIFKSVTGSDRVQAERKGKDPFTFIPRAKLVFAGNGLPDTSDQDTTDAFANRLIPLLFNKSIASEDQDPDLLDKLWEERNAIVSDALDAFSNWLARDRQWTLPEESVHFINRYRKTIKSDRLFLRERCALGEGNRVHNKELHDAYIQWCKLNCFPAVEERSFFSTVDNLTRVERLRFRDNLGRHRHGRKGIGLLPEVGTLVQTT